MAGIIPILLPAALRGLGGATHLPGAAAGAPAAAVRHRARGRLTFKLALERGFCHGVERAIRMARETLEAYPEKRVFITSPILHNREINEDLRASGVIFLSDDERRWRELTPADVVLLPAFGVPPQVRERILEKGSILVDTTCGSVAYVWKYVDQFARDGFTLIYHGRRGHEEAVATLARLAVGRGLQARGSPAHSPTIVLESLDEARLLSDCLLAPASARRLPDRLAPFASGGFDARRDLERIGVASQTTMLASETIAITSLLREAQASRFGADTIQAHFRSQETICGATQERQDALRSLLCERPDVILVVGGFASSNTSHLAELAGKTCPAFHVEGPSGILSGDAIEHKLSGVDRLCVSRGWLPPGNVVIGMTSGASTPESTLEAVIEKVSELA